MICSLFFPWDDIRNINGIDINVTIYIGQNPMGCMSENALCDFTISSRLRLMLKVISHLTYECIISQNIIHCATIIVFTIKCLQYFSQ